MTAATLTAVAAMPDDDYRRTERKAQRFFDDGEWQNANAMYMLMLDSDPGDHTTYAHAVMANVMLDDTAQVNMLMHQAMEHNVPIDSLLSTIDRLSTQAGHGTLYERLLLNMGDHFGWMQRSLDRHLLTYYDKRDNGPAMVRYALRMLDGSPDNTAFADILARGYMLTGRYDDAVHVWRGILTNHPDHYPTLLNLANYYIASGQNALAIPYLQTAYVLRPTPHVERLLQTLSPN